MAKKTSSTLDSSSTELLQPLKNFQTWDGTTPYTSKKLPDFEGKKAFVLPGAFYGQVVALMAEAGFTKATSVEDCDLVVFIGGADINPKLYSQKCLNVTHYNESRDEVETAVYIRAQELGKPCFGICRGAQFLHAMNDGQLWQDVNNHAGGDHLIYDIDSDTTVLSTSVHHQMLQIHRDLNIIAITPKQIATRFKDDSMSIDLTLDKSNASENGELEIEAGSYDKTSCFFVQGHPEIGSPEYRSWCMTVLYQTLDEWKFFDIPLPASQLTSITERTIG